MAFTCPDCGAVSHDPHDEANRYCGRCHRFVDDVPMRSVVIQHVIDAPLDSVALKRIIDEVRDAQEIGDRALGGYNRVYHRHNR